MKDDNKEKILEWQKESNRMYAGYFRIWVYDGEEYFVDVSKSDQMKDMGATPVPLVI